MTRGIVQTDNNGYINIAADEMDRDGDHVIFLRDGNLVGIVRLSAVISAQLCEDKREGRNNGCTQEICG